MWSYWIPDPSLSFSSLSNTTYIWPLLFSVRQCCWQSLAEMFVGSFSFFLAFCACGVPLRSEKRDSSRMANDQTSNYREGETAKCVTFVVWYVYADKEARYRMYLRRTVSGWVVRTWLRAPDQEGNTCGFNSNNNARSPRPFVERLVRSPELYLSLKLIMLMMKMFYINVMLMMIMFIN